MQGPTLDDVTKAGLIRDFFPPGNETSDFQKRLEEMRAEQDRRDDLVQSYKYLASLYQSSVERLGEATRLLEDLIHIRNAAIRCASHGSHPAESSGFAAGYEALRVALKLEGSGK